MLDIKDLRRGFVGVTWCDRRLWGWSWFGHWCRGEGVLRGSTESRCDLRAQRADAVAFSFYLRDWRGNTREKLIIEANYRLGSSFFTWAVLLLLMHSLTVWPHLCSSWGSQTCAAWWRAARSFAVTAVVWREKSSDWGPGSPWRSPVWR